MRRALWTMAMVVAGAMLLASMPAKAEVLSDRPAAVLVFPKVVADHISVALDNQIQDVTRDTLFQISNTSDAPVELKCFYVDATSRCSVSQSTCDAERNLECPLEADICLPGWTETDFRVVLTPQQPLAWTASTGMARQDVPLDGVIFTGIGGSSNAGTAIPPIAPGHVVTMPPDFDVFPFTSFKGELKCVAVDSEGRASDRNVLVGKATLTTVVTLQTLVSVDVTEQNQFFNVAEYSAVGIQAINGDANGDGVLLLGGDEEYNPCPSVLVMDHFFDFAANPLVPAAADESPLTPRSELTLVPCSEDLRGQNSTRLTVQYLVFNEFEQRFSTSTPLTCLLQRFLSSLDTPDPTRSIFSAFVAGTMTGQTRIRGVGGGVVGVLEQRGTQVLVQLGDTQFDLPFSTAARNLHRQGQREEADRLVLP